MGNDNGFKDITIDTFELAIKGETSIHNQPTALPKPRTPKSRAGVLSCLLLLVASEAAAVQWVVPHIVEAQATPALSSRAKSPALVVGERAGTPAQEAGVAEVAKPAPALSAATPVAVAERTSAPQVAASPRKARECDELVRDANALQAHHPALAVELFDIAITIDARNPHAHAGRAEALLRMNKPLEARLAIAEALRIRPKRERYLDLQSAIYAVPTPANSIVVATK